MGQFVAPSVTGNNTLTAAALALKLMPRKMRNDLNKEVRQMGNGLWRPIVDSNAFSKMDKKVLAKGARVKPGNPLTLVAASSKRPLRKGAGALVPDEDARAWEFGTTAQAKRTEYPRRNRSAAGSHSVTRRTARQMPAKSSGRVVYESAGEIAPRITAYWVQSIVRSIYKAHEGE